VDFATPEAKNAAILMSESHSEGRRLLIKDGASVHILILLFVRFYDSNPCTARPQATISMVAL
jgi:hypothetical protein